MKKTFLLVSLLTFQLFAEPMKSALVGDINKQIKSEFDAAYTYLAMANHAESLSLSGVAHFFTVHFYEELNHAREMSQFLNDQDATVKLLPLATAPVFKNKSTSVVLEMMQACLKHEIEQTAKIHKITKTARSTEAFAAETFFQDFVKEQVEEEALFTSMVDRFRIAGDNAAAIFALDHELGERKMVEIY